MPVADLKRYNEDMADSGIAVSMSNGGSVSEISQYPPDMGKRKEGQCRFRFNLVKESFDSRPTITMTTTIFCKRGSIQLGIIGSIGKHVTVGNTTAGRSHRQVNYCINWVCSEQTVVHGRAIRTLRLSENDRSTHRCHLRQLVATDFSQLKT